MIIHKDLIQGTPEWFDMRKGKMTASHAQAIGNNGKGLETYIYNLMARYYSSGEQEYFSNKHTERGNELEEVARSMYELTYGVSIEEVGFVELNEYVGCSPDGFETEEGGIEIKCLSDEVYFKSLINDKIESKYEWQIQMNLLVTGRKWWKYIAYNPNFKQSFIIKKILPDPKKFKAIEEGLTSGIELIKKIKNQYGDKEITT